MAINTADFKLADGRACAIASLVGSHNYGLNTEESDKDWKLFLYPSFDDLYYNRKISGAEQSPTLDYQIHSIRRLPEFLMKGHPQFIEVLFSKDKVYYPVFDSLFEQPERYARMNLPAFWKTCYGMAKHKRDNIGNSTSTTAKLVEKFGYDTKEAHHSYRLLLVLSRFMVEGSMSKALDFTGDYASINTLLDIKKGRISKNEFLDMFDNWIRGWAVTGANWYKEQKIDAESKINLDKIIKREIQHRIVLNP